MGVAKTFSVGKACDLHVGPHQREFDRETGARNILRYVGLVVTGRLGAAEFLTKPVDFDALKAQLKQLHSAAN